MKWSPSSITTCSVTGAGELFMILGLIPLPCKEDNRASLMCVGGGGWGGRGECSAYKKLYLGLGVLETCNKQ